MNILAALILIPTLYNGPGALGSRWNTTVVLDNHMDAPLTSPGVTFGILCPIPEGCFSSSVPAGSFGSIISPLPANGLLLYVPSEDAPIAFAARFGASPRNVLSQGSELPIVHEHELTRGPVRLPYVGLQGLFRTTLRIYAPDAEPGTSVRVELRSWVSPTGDPLESKVVALPAPSQPTPQPIFPGYAQLNLQSEFPRALQLTGTVVPLALDSGAVPRIWAFVTTVDNATQEVTVQRPQ